MHPFLWRFAMAAALAPHTALPARAELTLDAARSLALAQHPSIAAAGHERDAADGAAQQAGARPNPELALLVEDSRSATRNTTMQFNQPIELGGKRAARLAVAGSAREAAQLAWLAARVQVEASVAGAYHDTLAAQEALALAAQMRALAAQTLGVAALRVAAGKASPVDVTRAKIGAAEAEAALAQAEGSLAAARRRLGAHWGAPDAPPGPVEPVDPAPLAPLATLLRQLDAAPRLALARSEAGRRVAMVQLERARQTPDIVLSVGIKRDAQLGRDQAVFGVALPLPLFDRNQGSLIEATSRAARARDDVDGASLEARTALLQAYDSWNMAQRQAALYRDDIVPGARSVYAASARGFEFGKFAFLDVLDAQRSLLEASSRQLRAVADGRRAQLEIARLLGVPVTRLQEIHP